jgi:hypothetical protein
MLSGRKGGWVLMGRRYGQKDKSISNDKKLIETLLDQEISSFIIKIK